MSAYGSACNLTDDKTQIDKTAINILIAFVNASTSSGL
jgi:hypothetical protein